MSGKKFINEDVIYTIFKRHYCPKCCFRLERMTKSKELDSWSEEAKKYRIGNGDPITFGKVEFSWIEFWCPRCEINITIEEMKKIEKNKKWSAVKK